jgi:hypothetical protein
MPFTIEGSFKPVLRLRAHQETNAGLLVSLANWEATPTVTIQNEGGTYRIGWLQTVQRIEMKGIYNNGAGHRCEQRISFRTPIADRAQAAAPWYWDNLVHTPQVAGVNPGSVQAHPAMADQPSHQYPWTCGCGAAGGPAPLIEVIHELSFRTWLVVRDEPPPAAAGAAHNLHAVLYNFMYAFHKRFVVNTVMAVGHRATTATTAAAPGIERYDPPLPVPDCIWALVYANNAAQINWVQT